MKCKCVTLLHHYMLQERK